MEFVITIDDAGVQRGLERFPGKVLTAVEAALARGAMEMARTARERAPKAFTTLTNSIKADKIEPLHYVVAPHVMYAPFVERGRKPGRQPGTANGLGEWIRQKTGLQGKELDRRTFVIARAIGRRGIKAQPFMHPAFEAHRDRIVSRVRAAALAAAQEAFRG